MYQVLYAEKARSYLKMLDWKIGERIIRKISFYSKQADPLSFAKPLHDSTLGKYSFRIGDYRAIFDVDQKGEIHILKIAHRKEVYE